MGADRHDSYLRRELVGRLPQRLVLNVDYADTYSSSRDTRCYGALRLVWILAEFPRCRDRHPAFESEGTCVNACSSWETTKDIDEKDYYVRAKHVAVEFIIGGTSGLEVDGWNQQNVVFGINIEKTDSGYRVSLHACYGAGSSFEADRLFLNLIPGEPADLF